MLFAKAIATNVENDTAMNKKSKLVPIRPIVGYRMCINFIKLNRETQKNHKPIPFMDRNLERLTNNYYYCFLIVISIIFKLLYSPKIKRKQLSHVRMVLMLID